jgi:DNA-binding response OmpR family regulator
MHVALFTKDSNLSTSLRSSLHDSGFGTTLLEDTSSVSTIARGLDILIFDTDASSIPLDSALGELRHAAPSTPFLAISGSNEPSDRIAALRVGFDDSVSRSFPSEEIALRAQALVRRNTGSDQAVLRFADIVLDRVARSVTRSGSPVRLTEREYRTLEYFIRNPGRVISPAELCEQVWKFHFDPCSNVVQVFIMRLRKKIDEGFETRLIQTVPRLGYALRREPETGDSV